GTGLAGDPAGDVAARRHGPLERVLRVLRVRGHGAAVGRDAPLDERLDVLRVELLELRALVVLALPGQPSTTPAAWAIGPALVGVVVGDRAHRCRCYLCEGVSCDGCDSWDARRYCTWVSAVA